MERAKWRSSRGFSIKGQYASHVATQRATVLRTEVKQAFGLDTSRATKVADGYVAVEPYLEGHETAKAQLDRRRNT